MSGEVYNDASKRARFCHQHLLAQYSQQAS